MGISDKATVKTSSLGEGTIVSEFCTIEKNVDIGKNVLIHPSVTIYNGVEIGNGVEVFPGACLGKLPKDSGALSKELDKNLQNLKIGGHSIVGSNSVLYRSAKIGFANMIGDNSVIREKSNFDEEVIVGFNTCIQNDVRVGRKSRILQNSVVSSYTSIGEKNFISVDFSTVSDKSFGKEENDEEIAGPNIGDKNKIGPSVCVLSKIKIGNNNTIGAMSLITKDIGNGGTYYGSPAKLVKDR